MFGKAILALTACLVLTACGGGDRGLRTLSGTEGPDEFSVQPARPLELPTDASLPAPTPGAANRTDASPRADAIAALGGNPAAVSRGGVPSSDSALVARASRYGVTPGIRSELAAADEQFRKRRGRVSLFGFGLDRYFKAYARQSLDAYAELQRFRNLGVRTPTAPPQ